jgi:excisionase family DNA binding protein
MGDFDDNLTVAAAAKLIGVSKTRVDQFIFAGRLTVVSRAGGLRWLSRRAVEAFKAAPRLKRGPKAKKPPPAPKPRKAK